MLTKQWDRLVEQEGVLYRQVIIPRGEEVLQVVLPASLKTQVLQQLHNEHGHQGAELTTELVRLRCYWPGMHHDIKQWCRECERCQVSKHTQPTACAYMGHLLASRPNQILAIYFTILEPSKNGAENILVMTDVFSKYTQAIPTHDQRASTVARYWLMSGFADLVCPAVSTPTRAETLKATSFSSSARCTALRKATLPRTIQLETANVRGSPYITQPSPHPAHHQKAPFIRMRAAQNKPPRAAPGIEDNFT